MRLHRLCLNCKCPEAITTFHTEFSVICLTCCFSITRAIRAHQGRPYPVADEWPS
ncbi:MAG: hypothetical protein V3S01_06840 [Dehalococcoidia bacterium]